MNAAGRAERITSYADQWAGPWSGPLTLRQREAVNNTILRCRDAPGEPWYCFGCLADIPADPVAQDGHVCGETPPAPVIVEHKTRTSQPSGYLYGADGSRRANRRGGLMRDRGSWAICSCGWVAAGDDRPGARRLARAHRAAEAAVCGPGPDLTSPLYQVK